MSRRDVDRRQALAAFGAAGLGGLLAACGDDDGGQEDAKVPTTDTDTRRLDRGARCELTAEQTEGPYYLDVDSLRRDITEGRRGTRLALTLRVREVGSCRPMEDAVVDIWHCDADGHYSGFAEGDGEEGQTYLRGAQATNADGVARFTTIFPGWYPGRTPHIHAKVHVDRRTALTTQLYFPDRLTDRVLAGRRYAGRGRRDQTNRSDSIFDPSLIMDVERRGGGVEGLMTIDVRRS